MPNNPSARNILEFFAKNHPDTTISFPSPAIHLARRMPFLGIRSPAYKEAELVSALWQTTRWDGPA